MASLGATRNASDFAPWFRERPRLTVAVAGALFAGVLILRLFYGEPVDAVNLLYTLPVALLALAFGRTAGALAGLLAVALVVVWIRIEGVDLSTVGWISRVVPLLLLGSLLGDASDRLATASEQERLLEAATQRQRDAAEVNDTLVQGMSAAKWALEAGRHEAGLKTLEDTLTLGHQLVSKLLREADMGLDGHGSVPRN
jgi:signal transduction histidine kinase